MLIAVATGILFGILTLIWICLIGVNNNLDWFGRKAETDSSEMVLLLRDIKTNLEEIRENTKKRDVYNQFNYAVKPHTGKVPYQPKSD